MESIAESTETNPYLIAVYRKYRSLKKKFDKIKVYEAKAASGSALNEEQLALIAMKPSLVKSLVDIESVKLQIEEIANELAATQAVQAPQAAQSSPVVAAPTKPTVADSHTNTNPIQETSAGIQVDIRHIPEVKEIATQADAPAPIIIEPVVAPPPIISPPITIDLTDASLHKIVQLLHVCSRFKELTGKELPASVDYFGKSILGLTSIRGFRDTVPEAVRAIRLYLDEDSGRDHEVVRGISYFAMSIIIDDLTQQMEPQPVPVFMAPIHPLPIHPLPIQQPIEPPVKPIINPVAEPIVQTVFSSDVVFSSENVKPNINFYLAPEDDLKPIFVPDVIVAPDEPLKADAPTAEPIEEKSGKKQRRQRNRPRNLNTEAETSTEASDPAVSAAPQAPQSEPQQQNHEKKPRNQGKNYRKERTQNTGSQPIATPESAVASDAAAAPAPEKKKDYKPRKPKAVSLNSDTAEVAVVGAVSPVASAEPQSSSSQPAEASETPTSTAPTNVWKARAAQAAAANATPTSDPAQKQFKEKRFDNKQNRPRQPNPPVVEGEGNPSQSEQKPTRGPRPPRTQPAASEVSSPSDATPAAAGEPTQSPRSATQSKPGPRPPRTQGANGAQQPRQNGHAGGNKPAPRPEATATTTKV